MTESLTIRSRDGLTLEAAFDGDPTAGVVVFCHPHPRFGGTMEAPLLIALRDDLVGRGFAVLRFNFRGVGASEGTSGLGEEEVADAVGAVDAAASRAEGRRGGKPIGILGWSFGGAVAIRTAAVTGVEGCVGVAPSVQPKEGITAGLPAPDELGLDKPLLVVIGSNDEHVSPRACEEWTAKVPRSKFVEMPAANHFFWARYEELSTTVGDWLQEVLT